VALGKRAAGRGIEARFHLKIDTGMNRIGIPAEEAAASRATSSTSRA
jgi:alanine racemase